MKEVVVTNANQRRVAVTRAGGGLGRDIALALAAKNYRVFGTAFTSEEIEDNKRASSGAVTLPKENFGLTTNNQREYNVKSKISLLILAIGTQLPLMAQQPTLPEGPTATTSYTEAQLRQLVPSARPEDVSSPEAIVKAMHEAVSGPQGEWHPDRLRSLCVPNVFFESEDTDKNGTPIIATVTLDQLVKDFQSLHQATPWYEAAGNFSVTKIDRADGTILAVVSYSGVSNPAKDQPLPHKLTTTSTLLYFAKRWWIVNHTW